MDEVVGHASASSVEEQYVLTVEDFLNFALLRGELFVEHRGRCGIVRFADDRPDERLDAAGEHTIQRIIIGRRDRVVFVIVAAGTTDR